MDTNLRIQDSKMLVIMKIHGSGIHLMRHREEIHAKYNNQPPVTVYCHDLDERPNTPTSELNKRSQMKVFMLSKSNSFNERSAFQFQQPGGQPMDAEDLAIFMSAPMCNTLKASYAFDFGLTQLGNSTEDLSHEKSKKIGTAYLYLDSKFSTQSIQGLSIIGSQTLSPIGHVQIECLVVKNPSAYGVKVPRPNWLAQYSQLDAGHRGAGTGCRSDLPHSITENTLASFNYAAKHGADMCELDVMCTSDGIPVIYHNYTLNTSKAGTIQIDQLTLNELRNLEVEAIHDQGCNHDELCRKSIATKLSKDNAPFPTLEEVLRDVDENCALNIELKWPQLLPNGKREAIQNREINDNVDRILHCIDENRRNRPILLSTLSADIAILLRLKQARYPVLFLTTGDCQRFNDPTTKTIRNAIQFAQAFDLAGINPNAAYLTDSLVRCAQDRGLLVYAWGKIETAKAIEDLRRTGLDGVIYDKIDLIKPQD